LMQCEQAGVDSKNIELNVWNIQTQEDKMLIAKLNDLNESIIKGLEHYRLSEVGEDIYVFVWDFFCDWYLEFAKSAPNPHLLINALRTIVHFLHPYCPFVTEELWEHIKPEGAGLLMSQPWPRKHGHYIATVKPVVISITIPEVTAEYIDASEGMKRVIDVITAIRKLRTDQNLEPKKEVKVTLQTSVHKDLLESQVEHIKRLGKVSELTIEDRGQKPEDSAVAFIADIDIYMSFTGLIDTEKEKVSLAKEEENLERFIGGIEAKLSNEQFISKAPPALVEDQKAKLNEAKEKLSKIEERLKLLA